MEVCTKSWGSRWDCWYWQDITGSAGWASSGINKCKCWLSAHRRSYHHTTGPALTTCPGTESILSFSKTCTRNSCQCESCWLVDLERVHLLSSDTKTTTVFLSFPTFPSSLFVLSTFLPSFSMRAVIEPVTLWCQTSETPSRAAHLRLNSWLGLKLTLGWLAHGYATCLSLIGFLLLYI